MADSDFANETLGGFLERVASQEPAPGGGAAAAVAASLAAGLVGMAARFSEGQLADASDIGTEADRLRAVALDLASRDAEAYAGVLRAFRLPRDSTARAEGIHRAVEHAAEVPLAIGEVGASTAALAARLAVEGNPNLQGDAVVAVLLADSATRAAARLVEINVALGGLDGRWVEAAAAYVAASSDAVAAIT